MKYNFTTLSIFLFTILLVSISPVASAQWSDKTNFFADSLHMTVTTPDRDQSNSLIIRSYPDSGYIIIWQDQRNVALNKMDIYAQKYDKNGVALWTAGGIPVANGPNDQHYTYPFNGNYRNYTVAATDSAGGFYITWTDDSISTYNWGRVFVQNILSNGTKLMPGQGLIVAQTPAGESYTFSAPQLIADGHKGFFVSYARNLSLNQRLFVMNYKKENGALVHNGGGWMNEFARTSQSIGPCGIIYTTNHFEIVVKDYNIWPDGQGGCNVVMSLGTQEGEVIGFNRVVRVKKDCRTTVYRRTTDIANCNIVVTDYQKDDVVVLHQFKMYSNTVFCSQPGPPPVGYSQTSTYIETLGQGFLTLDINGYDYYYAKGVTLSTPGNINADVIGFNKRSLVGSTVTDFATMVVSRPIEKYDSLPYELCTNLTNCYTAMRFQPEGGPLNKLNNFRDTLLGGDGKYYYDFSIAGSGSDIYATALVARDNSFVRSVFLQNIKLEQVTADSFALQFNTPSNKGVVIGKEISTGFQTTNITYDDPMIAMDNLGNAVFHIRDYYRSVRVSPIINGSQLEWGAMGKAIGTGVFNGGLYRPEFAFLLMDPNNGTGLISWEDGRSPSIYGLNIMMRHLDSLTVNGHQPPNKNVRALSAGTAFGVPAVMFGTSKKYSVIDAYSGISGTYSPVVEILDDYNLGIIEVVTHTHTAGIRTHNGKPYLNRNYTIKVQNNPAGAANIGVRLYFTTAEFDAIKAADPSITTPGLLAVIKQANNTTAVPASYVPAAGEEIITPKAWAAVPGGYYIEIEVSSFSNFFLFKNENALPVTWVNVYAAWQNETQVKVNWQVTDEVNVEHYIVQHSKDGRTFTDECTVAAIGGTQYNCSVPGVANAKNYYRVKEVDRDGYTSYSKVVVVSGSFSEKLITLYPNPASRFLKVQAPVDMKEINIIDAQGRTVYARRGQNGLTTIDVSKFSKGFYTLMMTDNNGVKHYRKFMVE